MNEYEAIERRVGEEFTHPDYPGDIFTVIEADKRDDVMLNVCGKCFFHKKRLGTCKSGTQIYTGACAWMARADAKRVYFVKKGDSND